MIKTKGKKYVFLYADVNYFHSELSGRKSPRLWKYTVIYPNKLTHCKWHIILIGNVIKKRLKLSLIKKN